jgi:DNA-binding protein H-NS
MWRAGREAGFCRIGQDDIVVDMIKALEQAVEKVKKLSAERQEYAAAVLEQIAEAGDGIYTLTDEERRLVREGLDQLDRGDVATDAEVRAVFDKYRA